MIKRFIQKIGVMNSLMLLVVFSVIIVSEVMFLQGKKIRCDIHRILGTDYIGVYDITK